MARPSFLFRLRRKEPKAPADGPAPVAAPSPARVRRPLPPPGRLRRERRGLLRAREDRIRDLGGLVLEMYRRQDFRQDLLDEQCAAVVGIEGRLREVEDLLRLGAHRPASSARCECGAPILWDAHFCARCGRPVPAGETGTRRV